MVKTRHSTTLRARQRNRAAKEHHYKVSWMALMDHVRDDDCKLWDNMMKRFATDDAIRQSIAHYERLVRHRLPPINRVIKAMIKNTNLHQHNLWAWLIASQHPVWMALTYRIQPTASQVEEVQLFLNHFLRQHANTTHLMEPITPAQLQLITRMGIAHRVVRYAPPGSMPTQLYYAFQEHQTMTSTMIDFFDGKMKPMLDYKPLKKQSPASSATQPPTKKKKRATPSQPLSKREPFASKRETPPSSSTSTTNVPLLTRKATPTNATKKRPSSKMPSSSSSSSAFLKAPPQKKSPSSSLPQNPSIILLSGNTKLAQSSS